jgi:5-methylcytosine-specific restriction endonuclease McrA
MGRKRNGEIRQCASCKKDVYKSPSQLLYKRVICSKECHRALSFNIPCKTCGVAIYTQPAQIKLRARSTCSPLCRAQLRKKQAEQNRLSKGMTKHQIDRSLRYSKKAIIWRKEVFVRDDYTCQECFVRGTYLEADHIKPWAYFPKLRFELSNGRTLCQKCHNKTKIGAKKMKEIYDQARTQQS